jgi:hypothetical protein
MSDPHKPTSKIKPKSKLTILRGTRPALYQAGVKPAQGMPPGKYKVACESGRIVSKWGKQVCELYFRVVEGDYFGTVLPGWIPIYIVGEQVHPGRYTEQCALALGRVVDPGDDINPDVVFVGKVFLAAVAFKSTDGKRREPLDASVRKSESDFLRVVKLLERETL